MSRRRVVLVTVLVLVLAAGGLLAWRLLDRPSDYERAVGYLPSSTLRATYTDWAAVRSAADGGSLSASSAPGKVSAFLDRAFEQDLTSTSAVAESTAALAEHYGFSPLDVSWEVLGQAPDGQVVVLQLPSDADVEGIEDRLRDLGYSAPADGAGEGGTWAGTSDLVAALDPTLTPVMQNMAVLPSEKLLVMSDNAGPVSTTSAIVQGSEPGLEVGALTSVAGTPVTATLWAADFACEDLAMTSADEEDQRVAASLVEDVGGVSPLSGLVMAQQPDRSLTVGMLFESADQASDNLQARVDLAAGDAPGQGGTFGERFTITAGEADGEAVVLRVEPRGKGYVFSDISTGPVLFATC
ncbi:MAG: hypothetical protein ACXWXO_17105 [Nocardioides sp.]